MSLESGAPFCVVPPPAGSKCQIKTKEILQEWVCVPREIWIWSCCDMLTSLQCPWIPGKILWSSIQASLGLLPPQTHPSASSTHPLCVQCPVSSSFHDPRISSCFLARPLSLCPSSLSWNVTSSRMPSWIWCPLVPIAFLSWSPSSFSVSLSPKMGAPGEDMGLFLCTRPELNTCNPTPAWKWMHTHLNELRQHTSWHKYRGGRSKVVVTVFLYFSEWNICFFLLIYLFIPPSSSFMPFSTFH